MQYIMETKIKTKDIIERLKFLIGLKSDEQLAFELGVSRAAVSTWKSRNSLDWVLIFEKFPNFNLNYLIYGTNQDSQNASFKQIHDNSEHTYNAVCKKKKFESLEIENSILRAKLEQSEKFIEMFINREYLPKEVDKVVATVKNY